MPLLSSSFFMLWFSNVSFLIRRWYSNILPDILSMSFIRYVGIDCCGVMVTTTGSFSGA